MLKGLHIPAEMWSVMYRVHIGEIEPEKIRSLFVEIDVSKVVPTALDMTEEELFRVANSYVNVVASIVGMTPDMIQLAIEEIERKHNAPKN